MKTIAIFNLKGGVGKSMTTAAMADILTTDYKMRVLAGDADGQGNLTQYFGVKTSGENTMLELLCSMDEYAENYICQARGDVDLVPADMSLMTADIGAIQNCMMNLDAIASFRDAMAEDDAYDYFLIDCPPSFSVACQATLIAADSVIIPMCLDYFSVAGMAELMKQISNMREINPKLNVDGVLVTKYIPTEEDKAAYEYLKCGPVPVYDARIRYSPRVNAATYASESLVRFSPNCAAAKDYRKFVGEFLRKEGVLRG